MNLCEKYKPIYLSELEIEYNDIIKYINDNKTFIINGPKCSGKSTIIKLYLKYLNYDYLLIDDFNLSKECILEKITFRTNSVMSFFYNKKFTVLIDNFDLFDNAIKEYIINDSKKNTYILITNKFLTEKINYVRIYSYSNDYLLNLYTIIFYLENNYNCNVLPNIDNISQMYSLLEFTLSSTQGNASNASNASNDINKIDPIGQKDKINQINKTKQINEINQSSNLCIDLVYDRFNYNLKDIVSESNFQNKLYILDKINSYNIFHYNLIYNYDNIDDLANSYEYLSNSLEFYNANNIGSNNTTEYYSILSIIGTSYKLNNYIIKKENFQIRKKTNLL